MNFLEKNSDFLFNKEGSIATVNSLNCIKALVPLPIYRKLRFLKSESEKT